MVYQAIYRKWRPTTFEDVVGQSHITETLKTEIRTGRLAHAYLFCGTRGTGKTTTAKILSRAVNCENPHGNGNPCNECDSCKGILNNTILDVVEIDAASNNGVDNIRELRDNISYTPANVKYKIYIIDEVHMLSPGAFNALLKTLEEPPAHAIFILATTEPHKIPATIQSRCQRFDFRRISLKNIAGRIGEITRKDNIKITNDAINLVAELGDGSMRDALSILDLCAGIEGEITREDIENVTGAVSRDGLFKLSEALINGDVSKALVLTDKLLENGREVNVLIEELVLCFREMMIVRVVSEPSEIIDKSDEDIKKYKEIADKTSVEKMLYIIRTLSDTTNLCKTSANPTVMLEASVVKMCDPSLDATSESFALRIKKLEDTVVLNGGKVNVPLNIKSDEPIEEKMEEPTVSETEDFILKSEDDDGEEYVCSADDFETEYTDEDIPPFDIPPVFDAPDLNTDVKEIKSEEETYKKSNSDEESKAPENIDFSEIADAMYTFNPPLAPMLKQAVLKDKDGVFYVVFSQDIFRDTVSLNREFVEKLKEMLNCNQLKLVTEKEFFNSKKEKDPFEELLEKADGVEQISIL